TTIGAGFTRSQSAANACVLNTGCQAPVSGGVVEDDPEGRALAAEHRRDAVAHRRAVEAACALDGAGAGREDEERARVEVDHIRPRLLPRPALDEHELTAGEVADRAQQR